MSRFFLFFVGFVVAWAGPYTHAKIVLKGEEKNLVRLNSIGWARLGMKVLILKKAYPDAVFRIETLPGISAVVTAGRNGVDLFSFKTRKFEEENPVLPNDDDIISFLLTKNADFYTSEGIHPGSLVDEGVRTWGPVLIYYSEGQEIAVFRGQPESDRNRMEFYLTGASERERAGLYKQRQNKTSIDDWATTQHYQANAKILYITLIPK